MSFLEKIVLPKKPYKNFFDFVQKATIYCKKDVVWPCFCCRGWGEIYDPNDRDPIEGYKLACKIPCPVETCRGGCITEKEYRKRYREIIREWGDKFDNAKRKLTLQKSLINKICKVLTKEEMDLLYDL